MRIFANIKKSVVVLGVASFFTDISSEMLYPIIPIFLTATLGAPMSVVGLIEGVAESSASVLKAFSGWISDILRKRRPLVIGGYFLSSIGKLLLFFAYAWPAVLLSRVLDRIGKGVRTSPRDAMIADASETSYRGKAFGFHRAVDSLGACIGPLLAILFLTVLKENIRVVFLIAFVPALLAVLVLIFFLKETPLRAGNAGSARRVDFKFLSPALKRFLIATSIFAIGNSSDAFLIVRAKHLGLSLTMVILAYVLYNISYSLLSTPFGVLSDKFPRKNVMIFGYLIFAAVYLGFGFISKPALVWALFPVYGFYIAMTDGVGKALVSDMVASEYRATALGLYHFVLGIFAFFASVIAGLLWTHIGAAAPFIYGAVTTVASCLALYFFCPAKGVKYLPILFLGAFVFTVPALADNSGTLPQEIWAPPSAGPVTTWTAPLYAKGKLAVQPFFFYNRTRGTFNDEGRYKSFKNKETKSEYQELLFMQYSITDRLEIDGQGVFQQRQHHVNGQSASSTGFGDSFLFLRYCFLDEGTWLPQSTALFQLKFPTGKYRKANPSRLGTDLMGANTGGGSYDHGYGLILTKRIKPFILHADAIYTFPVETKVDGVNTQYANYLNYDFSVEYFLPRGLNLLVEFNGIRQGDTKADDALVPASDFGSMTFDAGIGWSNAKIQTLLAYQRMIAGTNTDLNDSIVFTFVYTF